MPYVRQIEIVNHPRQGDLEIDLTDGEGWRHLILTGPNGSGKTTILRELADSINRRFVSISPQKVKVHQVLWARSELAKLAGLPAGSPSIANIEEFEDTKRRSQAFAAYAEFDLTRLPPYSGSVRAGLPEAHANGTFVHVWLPDQRHSPQKEVLGPSSVRYSPSSSFSALRVGFHQYLVDQFVRAELNRRREPAVAEQIDGWLASLEASLAELFEVEGLKLAFGDDPYRVEFVEPSGLRYGFEQLAAGHASVLAILAEIILRVEGGAARLSQDDERLSGVVIIDEIDLHLHPAMQEKVLPFLLRLFPRFQFIVATHSPAVICSVDGAWVFDLKTRERVASEDLRGQQYGALMVDHFGLPSEVDLETTKKLNELRRLDAQDRRNSDDEARLAELLAELDDVSHPLVLEARLRQALRHEAARGA